MRHQNGIKKLGRNGSHRRALFRNLAIALLRHGRIKTTGAKAKALRPYVERLITLAKRGDLHSRRLAAADVHDPEVLQKLFGDVAERCRDRQGGYTRIRKLGVRPGDNSMTALIELVDREAPAAPAEAAAG